VSNKPRTTLTRMAGGEQERYPYIRSLKDVPNEYKEDMDRFTDLCKDVAHKGRIEPGGIREAMAAIEMEKSGIIIPYATRPDSPYIDFYDGRGTPIDVKTPPSPSKKDRWDFYPEIAGKSIISQLEKSHPNLYTNIDEPIYVALDVSYMTEKDRQSLWAYLGEHATEDQISRIVELSVDFKDGEKERLNKKVPRYVRRELNDSKYGCDLGLVMPIEKKVTSDNSKSNPSKINKLFIQRAYNSLRRI